MTDTPINGVLDIPGYAEAVMHERQIRESAFFPLNEKIGGFEVTPLTLLQYDMLRMIRSPLLWPEAIPDHLELAAFLWILSPHFQVNDCSAKRGHFKACLRFAPPSMPIWKTNRAMVRYNAKFEACIKEAQAIIGEARKYIADATMDFPTGSGKSTKSYYSDIAYLVIFFSKNCGWDDDKVLRTPLKRLLQYQKAILEMLGAKGVLANPSDAITGRWMVERNKGQHERLAAWLEKQKELKRN